MVRLGLVLGVAAVLALAAPVAEAAVRVVPATIFEGNARVTLERDDAELPGRNFTVEVVPDTASATPLRSGQDYDPRRHTVRFQFGERSAGTDFAFGGGRFAEPVEHGRLVVRDAEETVVADVPLAVHDDDAEFAETELRVNESAGRVTLRLTREWPVEVPTDFPLGAFTPELQPTTGLAVPSPVRMPAGAREVTFDATFPVGPDPGPERQFKVVVDPGRDPAGLERAVPRAVARITVLDEDLAAPEATLDVPARVRIGTRLPVVLAITETAEYAARLELGRATARRLRLPRLLAAVEGGFSAATTRRFTLRLRRAVTRRLRRARRVPARLVVTVEDRAGNQRTVRRGVTLVR